MSISSVRVMARLGAVQVARQHDDARHAALAARRKHLDPVARLYRAGGDLAAEAAEVEVRAVDPLNRHAERLRGQGVLDLDRLQPAHQRRAVVPGRGRARLGDVLTVQRAHRDGGEIGQADQVGEVAILGDDPIEDRLIPADQIHLVDRHDNLADAQQVDEVAVPAGLGQHAAPRVDQHHGGVGRRGAGDHVAGVLLMAGRIGDDELAVVGGEEAIGDIDGDALLALGGQAVDQQREVDRSALGADLLAVGLQSRKLVFEDHLAVVEQPADQGRLAVVDAAAGDEAQQRLVLVLVQVGVDVRLDEIGGFVRAHQK
jgi:hypothetical protein